MTAALRWELKQGEVVAIGLIHIRRSDACAPLGIETIRLRMDVLCASHVEVTPALRWELKLPVGVPGDAPAYSSKRRLRSEGN